MASTATWPSDSLGKVLSADLVILTYISYAYIVCGVGLVLILATGLTAPYGRYIRPGYGVYIKANIGWFIMESPAYVIPITMMALGNCPRISELPNQLFTGLYFLHYAHRGFIYPYLMKAGKSLSVTVFLFAVSFCLVNSYLQIGYLLFHAQFPSDWASRPHTYMGIMMFLVGMAMNVHSDHVLRTLRKPGEEKTYKIPKGGMFNYVSGANFLGEIIEWTGFAVATWSFPAFCFAFSSATNLGPRALQHHSYYLKKFDDYPKNRKALIPFIL